MQHPPRTWNQPQYGATQQLADPGDTTDPASDLQQEWIQKVTGTLIFYARAVNPTTVLMTLSTIAAQQSKATLNTVKTTNQLLDYCHTHPNATLKYRASDMILKIHSDASYNAEPKGRSRGGGHYYLGDKPSATPEQPQGPLLNRSNVIKNVMGSAAEAEVGALYDLTYVRESHYETPFEKWDTPNRPPLYKLTTPPPTALPTNKSNNKNPKQCKCDSIGYRTGYNRNNSIYIGGQDLPTWPIISLNITHQRTTNTSEPRMSTHSTYYHKFCEGVLIPMWD
jgi:hypothetical protein